MLTKNGVVLVLDNPKGVAMLWVCDSHYGEEWALRGCISEFCFQFFKVIYFIRVFFSFNGFISKYHLFLLYKDIIVVVFLNLYHKQCINDQSEMVCNFSQFFKFKIYL